jgi:hypothetical protein
MRYGKSVMYFGKSVMLSGKNVINNVRIFPHFTVKYALIVCSKAYISPVGVQIRTSQGHPTCLKIENPKKNS